MSVSARTLATSPKANLLRRPFEDLPPGTQTYTAPRQLVARVSIAVVIPWVVFAPRRRLMVIAGVVIGAGPAMISVMVGVMPLRMISLKQGEARVFRPVQVNRAGQNPQRLRRSAKSEEHTSELQSRQYLV